MIVKFYQSIARDPSRHELLLSALFSALEFDADPLNNNKCPWIMQMRCDFVLLEQIDDIAWLAAALHADFHVFLSIQI